MSPPALSKSFTLKLVCYRLWREAFLALCCDYGMILSPVDSVYDQQVWKVLCYLLGYCFGTLSNVGLFPHNGLLKRRKLFCVCPWITACLVVDIVYYKQEIWFPWSVCHVKHFRLSLKYFCFLHRYPTAEMYSSKSTALQKKEMF